ncbi:MAG: hypothetical protein IKX00_03380 [Bacilli bacterium]|nr:hypothetical protein [Bacilli bacterium]
MFLLLFILKVNSNPDSVVKPAIIDNINPLFIINNIKNKKINDNNH